MAKIMIEINNDKEKCGDCRYQSSHAIFLQERQLTGNGSCPLFLQNFSSTAGLRLPQCKAAEMAAKHLTTWAMAEETIRRIRSTSTEEALTEKALTEEALTEEENDALLEEKERNDRKMVEKFGEALNERKTSLP